MKFKTELSNLDQYATGILPKSLFFFLGIILLSISSKISIPFYPVPMMRDEGSWGGSLSAAVLIARPVN